VGRVSKGGVSSPHWGEVWNVAVFPPQVMFLNFQVKNAGFMHFYCDKLLVARNRGEES